MGILWVVSSYTPGTENAGRFHTARQGVTYRLVYSPYAGGNFSVEEKLSAGL